MTTALPVVSAAVLAIRWHRTTRGAHRTNLGRISGPPRVAEGLLARILSRSGRNRFADSVQTRGFQSIPGMSAKLLISLVSAAGLEPATP